MIGGMNQLVTIQSLTTVQDDYGSPIPTPATVATVYASILVDKRATDLEQFVASAGRERQRTQYTVTIYFRTDVTEENQLVWNGKTLDIRRVADPDGRRRVLEINAQEVRS